VAWLQEQGAATSDLFSQKNRSEVQKLRNYRKSDYTINKYSPNIVYRFHDEIIEVSLEDYLKENPDKTEQDFAELKALSDEIYYEQDRTESAQTRKDVSIHGLEEMDCCSTRPLEIVWKCGDEYQRLLADTTKKEVVEHEQG